jgi:hypothetical protein
MRIDYGPISRRTALAAALAASVAAAAGALSGCSDKTSADAKASKLADGIYQFDPAKPAHREFSGEKALAHARALVAFGPRPAGSGALEKSRVYLEEQLKSSGWEVDRTSQKFTAYTPRGNIEFANIRARFPVAGSDTWKRTAAVLIGSHYDTKLFTNFDFVGANDGASSSAALLEMARVLSAHPDLAQFVELVFFDGEEAVVDYSVNPGSGLPDDGLYGSRHYAKSLRGLPDAQRPLALLLLDMIGDKNLNVKIPANGTPELKAKILRAAEDLSASQHFSASNMDIIDDHVPFLRSGIAAVDVIDLDYPAWHTSLDTMEQISAASIEIVGRTTLLALEKYILTGK